MSENVLIYTVDNNVAMLSLNRPAKRNALNGALVQALKDALDRAARDDEARVVAIRGLGKDFCSGADLEELARISEMSAEENLADARSLGALFAGIRRIPKPVVAVVKGRALAGGCGLATACDIVLARDDAELGYPEVHLAFVPAMVMAILTRKVPQSKAFELVVRGDRIDAKEAERIGLVTRVFPAFTFSQNVTDYLKDLVSRPASALALTKSLLYELDDLSLDEGIERAAHVNVQARMSDECREGVRRFLEKSGD